MMCLVVSSPNYKYTTQLKAHEIMMYIRTSPHPQISCNGEPPAFASRSTTLSKPCMMLNNLFGSMPCADVKSVPVFLSDFITVLMAWYAVLAFLPAEKAGRHRDPSGARFPI
jgi:hypothetical protein